MKLWDPKQERVVNLPDEDEVCFLHYEHECQMWGHILGLKRSAVA